MNGLSLGNILKSWISILVIAIVVMIPFLMIYTLIFAPNRSSNVDANNKDNTWLNKTNLNETVVNNSDSFDSISFLLGKKFSSSELLFLVDASMQLESFAITESISLGLEKRDLPIVCIKDACFYTEIANNDDLRQKGLSSRENLPSDSAMLFVFNKSGVLNFWMKDMLFPLDLLWINEESKIVHIEKNLLPCSLSCPTYSSPKNPQSFSKYVLEINGGLSEIHNFSIGDTVKIII